MTPFKEKRPGRAAYQRARYATLTKPVRPERLIANMSTEEKEIQRGYHRRYDANRTEEQRATSRASSTKYHAANKGRINETGRLRKQARPQKDMISRARRRAAKKGWEFSITEADIVIPETCPLLGIPLIVGIGKLHPGSPSLDRKDPTRGYTKDNIWVISHRANTIKSDATLAELSKLVSRWQKL